VSIADYTVWRDALGSEGPNLPADGNNNQVVDQDDFGVWKGHYGQAVATGVNDVGIVDAAFADDVGDGYSATVLFDDLPVVSTGSGTADSYQVKWRVVEDPTAQDLASYAADLSGYGASQPLGELLTIDTTLLDDGYLQVALLGSAAGELGSAQGYQWLRDTRAPIPFDFGDPAYNQTASETPGLFNIEANWSDAQTDDAFLNSPIAYDVLLTSDAGGMSIVESQLDITSTSASFSDLAAGDYYLLVTATDAAGNVTVATGSPLPVEVGAPASFAITGPVGDQPSSTPFDITWEAADGAYSYEVRLDFDADCSDGVLATTTSDLFYTTTTSEGSIYACVTALGDFGSKDASNNGYEIVGIGSTSNTIMFATSSGFTPSQGNFYPPIGNLFHGADAAGWHCSNFAASVGLISDWDGSTVIYQALLGRLGLNGYDVLGGGEIRNVDGSLIAANQSALEAGDLFTAIKDENGNLITSFPAAWTGSEVNGAYTPGETCNDWTTNSSGSTARIGNVSATDSSWISAGSSSCNATARLICVGHIEE